MKGSRKLNVSFSEDFDSLAKRLECLTADQWLAHVNTKCYQGEWSVIPLTTDKSLREHHPILQAFHIERGDEWLELPLLTGFPEIQSLLQALPCGKKSVRLMKLDPAARILPHNDFGLYCENGEARLHIPLTGANDVVFTSNGKRLDMQIGELWYINAHQEHAVENRGSVPRINLVIDVLVNAWLEQKIYSDGGK